jgi:hypothetical protein
MKFPVLVFVVVLIAGTASADVFDMGGGSTSLDFVPVGG